MLSITRTRSSFNSLRSLKSTVTLPSFLFIRPIFFPFRFNIYHLAFTFPNPKDSAIDQMEQITLVQLNKQQLEWHTWQV